MKPRHRQIAGILLALAAYGVAAYIVLTRPGTVLSDDGRVTIRIAHWQIEEGPPAAMDALIERYEELNPHINVEQVMVPGKVYKQWLRTQLIGGESADIIEFGSFIGGVSDIPPRFFDPISSYLEESNPYNVGTPLEGVRWRDTFVDGLNTPPDTYIENLSNYYAVTLCMVTMRMFYNPELLQEVSGDTTPPATFTELLALGERLKAHNAAHGTAYSLLAGSQFNGMVLMFPLVSRSGLDVLADMDRFYLQGPDSRDSAVEFVRGSWNYRRPELERGLETIREVSKHLRPGFRQLDRDAAVQEFLRSRALIIVTGTWDATSLRRLAPFEVGVAKMPYPTMDDPYWGHYAWSPVSEGAGGGAMAFYLNKSGKHKAEAIDFLRFITSYEGNGLFAEKSGWLPVIREVPVPEYAQTYLPDFRGFVVRTDFMRGFGSETRDVWEQELHLLISPNGGVEPFLGALEPRFPEALRRDVEAEVRNGYLSLRRDLGPLTSLSVLDRLEGVDPERRRSRMEREGSQNLSEARLYEAVAVLRDGPAVDR
jgi:raffinose/stachyose/melibiose transport system substrate-binding protein